MKPSITICIVTFLATVVLMPAARAASVETKPRDASATFVETQHFIVGRIGRDCLSEIGRTETPLEYQVKWQRDNAKYFDAARKYLATRLTEIENPAARDTVERAFYTSAEQTGEAATEQLFKKGAKNEVCKYAITLVDSGSMNIEEFGKAAKLPIMKDVEELATWAKSP